MDGWREGGMQALPKGKMGVCTDVLPSLMAGANAGGKVKEHVACLLMAESIFRFWEHCSLGQCGAGSGAWCYRYLL